MMLYFNNPYDKVSVNTLQFLFVNDKFPMTVTRSSPADDRGFWISYLPTLILATDDGQTELARIENYRYINPDSYQWLVDNYQVFIDGGTLENIPPGVIIKEVTTDATI
jgi:hypothetical protein